jgi:hypothetical protein
MKFTLPALYFLAKAVPPLEVIKITAYPQSLKNIKSGQFLPVALVVIYSTNIFDQICIIIHKIKNLVPIIYGARYISIAIEIRWHYHRKTL